MIILKEGVSVARSSNQKLKLFYLVKILNEYSDEEHPLTMSEIINKLSLFGIKAERKSIYDDIECLVSFGYDIISKKGKNSGYFMGEREFELAELKLLVDSVQSSKFITKKKSGILIKKLEGLTSKHFAKDFQRQVYVADRIKLTNETVYYNVSHLHNAISQNSKISFKYSTYNLNKKREFRNNGLDYKVSPYNLVFSDDNYYLISHYPKNERLTHFRVDRMSDIQIINEKRTEISEIMGQNFNLGEYLKNTFDMFGGDTKKVSLLCDNSLINAVIDRFGEDVSIRKNNNETFIATVSVNVSPTFFAWVFTFGGKMKISSPDTVSNEFMNIAKEVTK